MVSEEESKQDLSGYEFHEINLLDLYTKTCDQNYYVATTDSGFKLYKKNDTSNSEDAP
jgi:hypothetical protein